MPFFHMVNVLCYNKYDISNFIKFQYVYIFVIHFNLDIMYSSYALIGSIFDWLDISSLRANSVLI